MSRGASAAPNKGGSGAGAVQANTLIPLPLLPRLDEKVERKKWCTDYDKIEADLLKNYLTPGDSHGGTSVTLGLRQLPLSATTFDRRLPAMDEPTEADRLELLRQQAMPSRRKGPQHHMLQLPQRAASTDPALGRSLSRSPFPHSMSMNMNMSSILADGSQERDRNNNRSPSRSRTVVSPAAVARSMSALNTTQGSVSHGGPASSPMDPYSSLHACVRVLDTLLHTPAPFRSSFDLNLQNIDLSWLWNYGNSERAPQSSLLTLETLREEPADDHHGSSRHFTVLNSPRSVIVMLQNGVTTSDLVRKPRAAFLTPTNDDEAVAEAQYRHLEDRRRALLQTLRAEYRDICARIPLHELTLALNQKHKEFLAANKNRSSPRRSRRSPSEGDGAESPGRRKHLDAAVNSSAVAADANGVSLLNFAEMQRVKAEKLAAKSKERLRKQMEAMQSLQQELKEADRRRVEASKELELRDADRKRILEERAATAAKHFAEMKEKAQDVSTKRLIELEARRLQIEAKEAAREAAKQQRQEHHRQTLEEKAKAKQERIQRNISATEAQKEAEAQRQREREAAAAEKREAIERRKAAERDEAAALQAKAQEHRHEAIERVNLLKQRSIQKALEREQLVDSRIASFHEQQRQQREALQQAERAKEAKRIAAAAAAQDLVAKKVQTIVQKLEEKDHVIASTNQSRQMERHSNVTLDTLAANDKRFLVERRSRCVEFRKLIQAAAMMEKQEHCDEISNHKRSIAEALAKEREQLRLQKEAVAVKLATI